MASTTLGQAALNRARAGLFEHGRQLEQLRFQHHFEAPIVDEVAAELARYQNPDGGFGHGIEPDFWLPDSSPMATSVGLQIAVELELGANHPIVAKALDYLQQTFDPGLECWAAVPPAVNDFPHAPWWHHDPDKAPDIAGLQFNPGVELAGYLLRWGVSDYTAWVPGRVAQTDSLEAHQLLCCLRLADSPGLPDEVRASLMALVERCAASTVEVDPTNWDGYCIKPLSAIPSPGSPLASTFSAAIDAQLDFEIARQSAEHGLWMPHWSWYGKFEAAWSRARLQWAGVITVDTLRALAAFGRVA